ncbi:hypothetical protein [Clavibacter capsici]|uniref:hypothetical protein n=1 Tax=Clavibacter capsici TaxID=1874630 RepID=UPI001428721C|nr:hypothetical protein [Clavibacter capsici]QIS39074.1 hypothetical protein GW572_07375 [Clavibacter capsici]
MGAQLVGRAFAFAVDHQLPHHEVRVLAWMALRALDTDSPPRYFAARESTALALGHRVPDEPDPDDPDADAKTAERERAFQRVKVAVRGLVNAGAITRLHAGREGQRAVFAITLGGPRDAETRQLRA